MKLNLGCGLKPMPECLNIDNSTDSFADLIWNLENGLPFRSETIDEIHTYHTLEHIENIIELMNECYRVLKNGGMMYIKVPQGDGAFADPTHKRFFNLLSFRYYCGYGFQNIYGITCKFQLVSQEIIPNQDGGELYVVLQKWEEK